MATRARAALNKKPAVKYHHGALREALLEAAWVAVSKDGVESLSLRSLADELGVSHGAPAHHFASREALLEALKAETFRRFTSVLNHGASTGALEGMGLAYVRFAMRHPQQLQVMFRKGKGEPDPEVLEAAMGAWRALVVSVAKQVGDERAADEEALAVMALTSWAMVHGLAALWSQVTLPPGIPAGGPGAEAIHREAIATLIAGLGAMKRPGGRSSAASTP
jgi:AcrR family transcriptional regulator